MAINPNPLVLKKNPKQKIGQASFMRENIIQTGKIKFSGSIIYEQEIIFLTELVESNSGHSIFIQNWAEVRVSDTKSP